MVTPDCATTLAPNTLALPLSSTTVDLEEVLERALDPAIRSVNRTSAPTYDARAALIIFRQKYLFELRMIELVTSNGETLARYQGRLLSAAELVEVKQAREVIRFWRPYMDLRMQELNSESIGLDENAKYALAVRRERLRVAVATYAGWAPAQDVTINWAE